MWPSCFQKKVTLNYKLRFHYYKQDFFHFARVQDVILLVSLYLQAIPASADSPCPHQRSPASMTRLALRCSQAPSVPAMALSPCGRTTPSSTKSMILWVTADGDGSKAHTLFQHWFRVFLTFAIPHHDYKTRTCPTSSHL